jgi:hypothetical protein
MITPTYNTFISQVKYYGDFVQLFKTTMLEYFEKIYYE